MLSFAMCYWHQASVIFKNSDAELCNSAAIWEYFYSRHLAFCLKFHFSERLVVLVT